MHPTRRSLASTLLGSALLPPVLQAGSARAQAVSAPAGLDLRGQLLRARAALPRGNRRGLVALDRTIGRFDDLGIDLGTGRVILVNIAAAELIAYDSGREALRSRVVVGADKTRTPPMTTFVTTARCNPPWYVPASIEREVRAAGIAGFNVVNGRLIQPPGPNNPLGPIRIGLLDSDGIFLHGTNAPALFGRADRALSHGCVRVERVRDLAAWMLDQTPSALQARLATGRTLELLPTQEVQVALAYFTAWPDAAGRLVLHADPYRLDVEGARRVSYRRILRPVPQTPAEAEAATTTAPPEDDPL